MKTKNILYVLLILLVVSCSASKTKTRKQTDTEQKNDIVTESTKVTEEKREGGNIVSHIKPIEKRERDENGDIKELIEEIRDGGLTKTIYYKPDGSVDVECTADEIWKRIEEKQRQKDESIINTDIKEATKEKESMLNGTFIIYVFLGLAGLLVVSKLSNKFI